MTLCRRFFHHEGTKLRFLPMAGGLYGKSEGCGDTAGARRKMIFYFQFYIYYL
jgi:hypothetical protein